MTRSRFITIGPSHYCEKARWALDRAGVDYVEEAHLPIVHWAHVYPKTKTRTVPVLLAEGLHLTESAEIVRYADRDLPEHDRLIPTDPSERDEALALEARFDAELGPATRRHVYCYLVDAPEAFAEVFRPGLRGLEARGFPLVAPVLRAALRRAFRVSARAAERTREACTAIFDEVATKLGERRHLVGEQLSVADVAFVSLASPVLLLGRDDTTIDALPEGLRATVRAMRAHPAGRWAMRVHAEERHLRVKR